MRVMSVLAGLAALACAAVPARAAAPFTAIYAFGDSLSDAGNLYVADGGQEPVSPPYSHGRFTNGPLWVQLLARVAAGRRLAPSLLGGHDFAYGGAQSGQTAVHPLAAIDLPSQLAQFIAAVPHPRRHVLYTLWIGANDLFAILTTPGLSPTQIQAAEAQIIGNEAAFVSALAARGARRVLVVTVPDLGKVPDVTQQGPAASAAATALSADFDAKLVATLRQTAGVLGLRLVFVNSLALIDQAVADPAAYGFTDATDRCWTGSYTNPASGTVCGPTRAAQDTHLFWDGLHPTARGHRLVAQVAEQALGLAPTAEAVRDQR